jgi:hypothetical protein
MGAQYLELRSSTGTFTFDMIHLINLTMRDSLLYLYYQIPLSKYFTAATVQSLCWVCFYWQANACRKPTANFNTWNLSQAFPEENVLNQKDVSLPLAQNFGLEYITKRVAILLLPAVPPIESHYRLLWLTNLTPSQGGRAAIIILHSAGTKRPNRKVDSCPPDKHMV